MTVVKNKTTEAGKEFWGHVEAVAEQVRNANATSVCRQQYVVGFMFDINNPHRVALIKKNRPEWQAGLLNGIGGKVEPLELNLDAMIREFWEETGVTTHYLQWQEVCTLSDQYHNDWGIKFYACRGDVTELKSVTDEEILVFDISCVHADNAIPNLTWLLPLAKLVIEGRSKRLDIQEVSL